MGGVVFVGGEPSSSPLPPAISEDDDGGRKWSGRCGRTEAEPSPDEPDFTFGGILMPPSGIGTGGNKADDGRSLERRVEGLLHPLGDFPAVGRVHPADPLPLLTQAVRSRREVTSAFGVFRKGTNIQVEAKLGIQAVEYRLRRGPNIGQTRKHSSIDWHGGEST